MNQHLGVAMDALIELLVRLRGVVDVDVVTDDEAGLGAARDDQVAQVAVVGFDVALARSEVETLDGGMLVTGEREECVLHAKGVVQRGFVRKGEGKLTFSNSLPKLNDIIPFALFSSGAPGSPVERVRRSLYG